MSSLSSKIPEAMLLPLSARQKRLFLAGKGGVGKTTMACATALLSADHGRKTLLVTTDPAAHLGSVLKTDVTSFPSLVVGENLWAVRIDPKAAFERYKNRILTDVNDRFGAGEALDVVKEELDSPCTEEIAVFQEFLGHLLSEEYPVVVFDTAPTGHTLRLLQLAWDYETELSQKASFAAETSVLDREELNRMQSAIRILKDRHETTMMFVTLAESTPMAEMERAISDLENVGIDTQAIIVNQMLPKEAETSRLFGPQRARQQAYLRELAKRHANRILAECELSDDEVTGVAALRQAALQVFASKTATVRG